MTRPLLVPSSQRVGGHRPARTRGGPQPAIATASRTTELVAHPGAVLPSGAVVLRRGDQQPTHPLGAVLRPAGGPQ